MYEELGKLVRARPLQEASMKNVTCHQLWKVKKKVRKNIKKLVQSSYNDSTFSVVYAVFPLIGGIMTTFFIRFIKAIFVLLYSPGQFTVPLSNPVDAVWSVPSICPCGTLLYWFRTVINKLIRRRNGEGLDRKDLMGIGSTKERFRYHLTVSPAVALLY